jgi:TAZ zinc finger
LAGYQLKLGLSNPETSRPIELHRRTFLCQLRVRRPNAEHVIFDCVCAIASAACPLDKRATERFDKITSIFISTLIDITMMGRKTTATGRGDFESADRSSSRLVTCTWTKPRGHEDLECKMRLEMDLQDKLLALHHASTCPHYGPLSSCPDLGHCCALKLVYRHVISCRTGDCDFPGCRQTRQAWLHYRNCSRAGCQICGVVPNAPPYSPILHKKDARYLRPPLSPRSRNKSPER